MFVRVKDGFYAGEIREFPSHIALELMAQGRAENPYAEPVPVASAPAPAVQVKPSRTARGTSRR